MESKAGTLTLQKHQYLSPVRDNTQEDSQREDTQMRRTRLNINDQAPMMHQGKTGKIHPNGNSTRTMRLGGTTVVTAFRVTIPAQGNNDQSAIQICNSIY